MDNTKMFNVDEIYKSNSQFLKAADIKGYRPIVEIEDFEIGEVGAEKKPQVILKFKNKDKKLGCNKTNAERMAVLSGSKNPADWIGAKIRLYVDPSVEFQGKKVEAVRISLEFWEAPQRKLAAAAIATNAKSQPPDPEGWNEYTAEDSKDGDVPF